MRRGAADPIQTSKQKGAHHIFKTKTSVWAKYDIFSLFEASKKEGGGRGGG
jgi:hypothetical protein